jgi:hypothetical protein
VHFLFKAKYVLLLIVEVCGDLCRALAVEVCILFIYSIRTRTQKPMEEVHV